MGIKCTGVEPLPYRSNASSWPHGRHECPTCHGFYFVNNDGSLAKHVPHKGDNAYEAVNRATLA